MKNVFRVLLRDIKRLLKAPAAMIVIGALIVLPSFYTWYNVVAFWNPYDETGNLRVSIVNLDEGASNELTGDLDVGGRITEELEANESLDWVAQNYDVAMDDLKKGDVYAVYVIPKDFSECLISPLTGELKSPDLNYFVNEKLGPVSPKITDVAADTLDQTINSMFVSTVSDAAVAAIDDALVDTRASLKAKHGKLNKRLAATRASIREVGNTLSNVKTSLENAKEKTTTACNSIDGASAIIDDMQVVLQSVSNEAAAVKSSLSQIQTGSIPMLSRVLKKTSQATAKASVVADGFMTSAGKAQTEVNLISTQTQPLVSNMKTIAGELDKLADKLPDSIAEKTQVKETAADLLYRAEILQTSMDQAVEISNRVAAVSKKAAKRAKEMNNAASAAAKSPSRFAEQLFGESSSRIDAGLSEVERTSAQLATSIKGLNTTVTQSKIALQQLNGVFDSCVNAISSTEAFTKEIENDLGSVTADIKLLFHSGELANLVESGTLNAQKISEFMGSPTKLETTELYAPNAYGAAMAPLFMNLTFWIGAFMLVVIIRLEVDSEGIQRLTLWQRYLSRLLLFAGIAILQAIVCCAGTLAFGVQASNIPALYFAAVAASLAFLSLIFALSVAFRHIGKALCIVLVFAQIPGGSGLYPVEMTSSFFKIIYPYLPFTYGIDAMREAICGLYGDHFLFDMAVLAVFFIGSLVLGLLVTSVISNVTRITARQVRQGDLYNREDVEAPIRSNQYAGVVKMLTGQESHRKELEKKYIRFSQRYPVFIRAFIIVGVVVMVILSACLTLDTGQKAFLLTVFLLWLVGLFILLVVVETFRYRFERELGLRNMNNERLVSNFLSALGKTSASSKQGGGDDA